MPILESLIISSCMNLSGDAQTACNKALEAGSKQSGIEAYTNDREETYTKNAEYKARDYLGDERFNIVSATVFVAKSAADKNVSVGLPTLGLADKVNAQVGADKSTVKLEWKF